MLVWQVTNNGRVARVDTRWYFGAIWYSSTFVVLRRSQQWIIDDVYCVGHPETSVYRLSDRECKPTIPTGFYPRGTVTPALAVSAVVSPFYRTVAGTCLPVAGMVFTCPITLRLPRYLVAPPPWSNTFCRCQNGPTGARIQPGDNHGRIAHVPVGWYFGSRLAVETTTFVVVHVRTGWLVDDQTCSGRAGTSIYSPKAGPCR
jgi:hypothetical protein